MSSTRSRRIAKELDDIHNDVDSKITVFLPDDTNLLHLHASFLGPPETPYEGGTYLVDINIPYEYPFRPPQMKFKTKLWHPNVSSQTGAICLDTLGTAWSPVLTIKSALLSLQSLLCNPEPKDPQDAEVASMLINNPDQFKKVAREWAKAYASAPEVTAWDKMYEQKRQPVKNMQQKMLSPEEERQQQLLRYQGYNKDLVDRFVNMGFEIERVVEAFNYVNIDRNNGEDYELEEAYMGDITAWLLGEP